jgi:predicted phosphodiesterase
MPGHATLRIQLASDLHLEHLERDYPGERLIAPAFDADLLVLAGDIHNGTRAIELFGGWPVPVLYVAGNHEYYGAVWEQARAALRRAARGSSVVFLDNDVADLSVFEYWYADRSKVLERVRFLGCTLWTDYRYRCNRTQQQMMDNAELRLADHSRIRTKAGPFRAADALRDHEASRAWLKNELSREFDGTTVVITHHGPHPLSVHPRYAGDPTNACFVSDQSELLHRADLWLHGHVHDSFDYKIGQCRVVANPRGYAQNRGQVATASELQFENAAFSASRVLVLNIPA